MCWPASRSAGRPVAGLALFLLLPLWGCAGLFSNSPSGSAGPERVLIDSVPFYAQEKYQCGPASLAMLLAWSGLEVTPDQVSAQVYSPALEGSLQPALVAAARRHGRLAYPLTGREALLAELAAGHPVLVLQNLGLAWFPRWHYAVVIGYDRGGGSVILHSGREAALPMSARRFANTWARGGSWGLVVLPPDRLPATVDEKSYLAAVVGLERAGQVGGAAVAAYEAALKRWPASFGAWVGLGNSRYARQDYAGAAMAFSQAIALRPDNGPVLNNLALALAASGRRQEALAVIRQAVELGGELREEFMRTRQEIMAAGEVKEREEGRGGD